MSGRENRLPAPKRPSLHPPAAPLTTGANHTQQPLHALDAASTELLRYVPADVWCAVMLDPATLLDTGGCMRQVFPPNSCRGCSK